jgi:hypothetical protein
MPTLAPGWVKWENGLPTEQVIGLVVDGFTPPKRKDLGDTDECLYFCVSTVKPGENKRSKETLAELNGLHVDIDFRSVEGTAEHVERALRCARSSCCHQRSSRPAAVPSHTGEHPQR